MEKAKQASFSLDSCRFVEFSFKLDKAISKDNIEIGFNPSGIFDKENHSFELLFKIALKEEGKNEAFIKITNKSVFVFDESVNSLSDVPSYFYANSIAIVFPYIRAFVGTLSQQAYSIEPITLPTMNLFNLKDVLEGNATEK